MLLALSRSVDVVCRQFIWLLSILVAGLTLPSAAWSDQTAGEPSVALYRYFPYGWVDETGQPVGVFIDIFRAIEQRAGLELQKRHLPLPRALKAVEVGQADFLISYRNETMARGVVFLEDIACATELLVPNSQAGIQQLSDLTGRRVAFPRNGYFAAVKAVELGVTPYAMTRVQQMFNMLVKGRLDAFVMSSWVLQAYLNDDYNHQITGHAQIRQKIGPPIAVKNFTISLSISKLSEFDHVGAQLRSALAALKQSGEIDSIISRHGLTDAASCDINFSPGKILSW